jgi:hypothetical protein
VKTTTTPALCEESSPSETIQRVSKERDSSSERAYYSSEFVLKELNEMLKKAKQAK